MIILVSFGKFRKSADGNNRNIRFLHKRFFIQPSFSSAGTIMHEYASLAQYYGKNTGIFGGKQIVGFNQRSTKLEIRYHPKKVVLPVKFTKIKDNSMIIVLKDIPQL